MEKHEFLPLGSIIRLKTGTKRLMIYGRCQTLASTGDEFDYLACPYPEGFINPQQSFVFDHHAIEEVIHRGFADEEDEGLQQVMLNHRVPINSI